MSVSNRMNALLSHGYALVDQSRIDMDRYAWYASLPLENIDHYATRGDTRLMPRLLRIEHDAPWLEALARDLENDEPLISCLLKSPMDRHGLLMEQLLNRVVVYIRNKHVILRFYDLFVFQLLLGILRPVQIVSLLGPIQAISFPFQGELITHTPPEVPPGERVPAFWTLRGDQLRRVSRCEDIYQVMTWYKQKFVGDRWPYYSVWAEIQGRTEQAMERALCNYALHGLSDQQAFARHTLQYGEHFHLHTRIQDLMDALPPGESPNSRDGYREAANKLDRTDWARISAPLY